MPLDPSKTMIKIDRALKDKAKKEAYKRKMTMEGFIHIALEKGLRIV